MKQLNGLAFSPFLAFVLAACGGSVTDGTTGSPSVGGAGGSGGAAGQGGDAAAGAGGTPHTSPMAIDWAECSFDPAADDGRAQCATVNVPLDYAEPDGETIELRIKRLPAANGNSRGQVWILHGGPGASAVHDMHGLARTLPERHRDLDIVAVDHRGTGGAARLSCPGQESSESEYGSAIAPDEWPACIEYLKATWGDRLNHISASNSARDIGLLAGALNDEAQSIYVYGGSYGTYLANRYLQIHPDQPDAVVLEGISASGQGFDTYDSDMNDAGQALFDICADDSSCASRLGSDPWQTATDVVASFDEGHCPELNTNAEGMRGLFGAFLFYGVVRQYVPALVYRAERCTMNDVRAIANFYNVLFGPSDEGAEPSQSHALFFHVALSEMWHLDGDPKLDDVVSNWSKLTAATGLVVSLAERQADWPRYPRDEFVGKLAAFGGPMLMLQGELDAATPYRHATRVRDQFSGPNQNWAAFPTGAHDPGDFTPLAGGSHCAMNLFEEFLDAPNAPLDMSCIDDVLPINFDGDPAYNQYLLGTADTWD